MSCNCHSAFAIQRMPPGPNHQCQVGLYCIGDKAHELLICIVLSSEEISFPDNINEVKKNQRYLHGN